MNPLGGSETGSISMSCHILDTMRGTPASGMKIFLEYKNEDNQWTPIHDGETNEDGRVKDFPSDLQSGTYRMTFYTKEYFQSIKVDKYFYPVVNMTFITTPGEHFHIPLLISPFGYTTYRGS